MKELNIVNDKMTTLDFAELTGTNHNHVLDKARKLLNDLEIGETNFRSSYLSTQNKQLPMLALDRDLSLTLAGQYEPKIAYQVAKAFNNRPVLSLADQLIQSGMALKAKELELQKSNAEKEKIYQDFVKSLSIDGLRDYKDTADRIGIIGFGRNTMLQCLRDKHWINKSNKPYRSEIDNGRFVVKTLRQEYSNGDVWTKDITMVTEKGLVDILVMGQNWLESSPDTLDIPVPKRVLKLTNGCDNIQDWFDEGWTKKSLVKKGYAKWRTR